MPTASLASNHNRTLTGLLWGAFAILAAIGTFESPLAIRIVCWSLALLIAFVLVSLARRSDARGEPTT